MSKDPLCFILMPFGQKPSMGGHLINFDAVYRDVIENAVKSAKLEPLRADEEQSGGIIHKPMFERLVLCEYAIADLTTANANVFYELGVRHAVNRGRLFFYTRRDIGRLPFDVTPLRALPYQIGSDGCPVHPIKSRDELAGRLLAAKLSTDLDSPLYQLLDDYPDVAHEKTDVFRDRVAYAEETKKKLSQARKCSRDDIFEVEKSLGTIADLEAGIVVDLFLSYRAVKAWEDMIRVEEMMNPILRQTVLVREQLGFP